MKNAGGTVRLVADALCGDCAKNPEKPFTKRAGYDTMRAEKGGVII